MIIDFHTHVFPEKIASATIGALASKSGNYARTNGTVDGLLEHMLKSDVDLSVALPVMTKPSQFESITKFAIKINDSFCNSLQKRIISFAGIHPKCDDIAGKMQFIKDNGFLGVKIHPDYQNAYIDDNGYLDILSYAKKLDLIVVTHAGVDDGYKGEPVKCPPELCAKVIDSVNHNKFVLGHYGGHKQWEKVLELLCGKDVFFDTAYTFHEIEKSLFLEILKSHGEDKILFATDCPWRGMDEDLKILRSFNLEKETLDKILYKNALSLLGL